MSETLELTGDSTSWQVVNGIKLFTLRQNKSKYNGMFPGTKVVLKYDQGFDGGVIFSREEKPLKQFTLAELYLDGYRSVYEAAADLSSIKGYESVTLETPMLGLGFTKTTRLESYLSKDLINLLFSLPLKDSVQMTEFHNLFLPSYLGWLYYHCREEKKYMTVKKWHELLINLEIFDADYLRAVRDLNRPTRLFYDMLNHEEMLNILFYAKSNSPQYQSLVLCQPVTVKR